MSKRRLPFTDGMNSMAHVAFGLTGLNTVAIGFTGYQIAEYQLLHDTFYPEMVEFGIGWVLSSLSSPWRMFALLTLLATTGRVTRHQNLKGPVH